MRVSLIAEKFKSLCKKCSGFFSTLRRKLSADSSDSKKLNKLIRSSVALVLMIVLFITVTFSWMINSFSSKITNSNYITIDADAGLQMNYGEEQSPDGSININNALREGFALHECSSTDGRTIFFPVADYASSGDKNFVTNVNTTDLVFREATANDKNTKYISVDFTLSSKDATDVWLSSQSYISCTSGNPAANAIRVAFIDRSIGGESTVFDNTVDTNYSVANNAVKTISTTGLMSETEACTPHTFNEYTYGNTEEKVLFHIDAGETLRASMIIWLEGTDADCDYDVLDVKDLNIYVKFTTSYEELRTITFVDNTLEKWVEDDECYIYIIDNNNNFHAMTMSSNYANDYTWTASIPSGIESIRFTRYNPEKQGDKPQEWNYWEAGDIGECSTYYAFGHSAGMWTNTFSGQQITVFDGTNNGWLRGSDQCEFHVAFTATDGNGISQSFDYKMSYLTELNRYSIIIPSNVTTLSFKRMDSTQTTTHNSWTNLSRGSNYFYNITASGTGYWSTRYIYINDANGLKGDAAFGAYFYNNSTGVNQWTGMNSKSPSGYYVAVVPNNIAQGVVFTRYNSSSDPSWNNCYNQTPNTLEAFGSNNRFTTSGWTGNNNSQINGYWDYTSE
ncbi:MAG: hypothetical protein IJ298_05305 [Ruminococcus sp.]|nr:hypothetical protein [Ruminococcus sp.]